ncbi:hypothetical protein VNO80_03200 [Phaseolus coccineus]|uniref:Flavin-containing monooxygenase n=1 Tax=Phaseolus coccineus TaxID=3886 RepID=A0AAN9NY82_PHACN
MDATLHCQQSNYAEGRIITSKVAFIRENFFSEAEKGKIVLKKASKWRFWNGGIEFEDNSKLNADVVILATGFDGKKKLNTILPEPYCSLLGYYSECFKSALVRDTFHGLPELVDDNFRTQLAEDLQVTLLSSALGMVFGV